jgi:hypothetical protein
MPIVIILTARIELRGGRENIIKLRIEEIRWEGVCLIGFPLDRGN